MTRSSIQHLSAFLLLLGMTTTTFAAPIKEGCSGLNDGFAAHQSPELKPSERKGQLIEQRQQLKQNGDPQLLKQLRGWGGSFQRDHTLDSGEKLSISAMSDIKGEVLFLRHLVIGKIERQKFWRWSYEYVDTEGRAKSSPKEMRQILDSLITDAKKAGISLLVLEGLRQTGARSDSKPWIQVVIDLKDR